MIITISGPPGSGKTTACTLLSEKLGYRAVSFGKIFREIAAERNIPLNEFGAMAEKDPSIDADIDGRIVEIAKNSDDIILESRLSAHMCVRNGISAFKVYINASPEVRMSRINVRENGTLEAAISETVERQKSEAKRYMMYYGIDIGDLSIYDLVIDSDALSPEGVLEKITEALEANR